MVAGINGASNSPANRKKTKNVAWSPPQKVTEQIMPKTQWHNERLRRITTEGVDIGPWPGKKK